MSYPLPSRSDPKSNKLIHQESQRAQAHIVLLSQQLRETCQAEKKYSKLKRKTNITVDLVLKNFGPNYFVPFVNLDHTNVFRRLYTDKYDSNNNTN